MYVCPLCCEPSWGVYWSGHRSYIQKIYIVCVCTHAQLSQKRTQELHLYHIKMCSHFRYYDCSK